MVKLAIIGSRKCENQVKKMIADQIPPRTQLIISGGAKGVDTFAEELAKERQIPFQKILPEYTKYGRRAPLIRNQAIVLAADLVLAFWDYTSRGTANTIVFCIQNNIPIEIYGIAGHARKMDTGFYSSMTNFL